MGKMFQLTSHYLRMWDFASASRVDYFVANSYNVASRIRKHYRRDATVIYSPVSVSTGYASEQIGDYHLVASRLMSYKRVDLAIEACNRLKRPLRIIGDGDQYKRLRKLAGSTVRFLGRLDDKEMHENYAHCRALLFPGEEDFSIVPVEAQSFGRPIIAYGKGGVLEAVHGVNADRACDVDTATGVFFAAQTPILLAEAIQFFESVESGFSPTFIRQSVEWFGAPRFKSEMSQFIEESLRNHKMSSEPASNKFDRAVFS